MKHRTHFALALAAALCIPAFALAADTHHGHASAPAAASTALSTGEIKKVDKAGGKLTIKHGPLDNLRMPGMTMIFRVKEPAMLDQVKAGDKVRFAADKVNGALTVTKIEAAS